MLEVENKQLKQKVATLEAQLQLKSEEVQSTLPKQKGCIDVKEESKNCSLSESAQECNTGNEHEEGATIASLLKEIALEEDYHYRKIPQMIKADPSSVRLTMMET